MRELATMLLICTRYRLDVTTWTQGHGSLHTGCNCLATAMDEAMRKYGFTHVARAAAHRMLGFANVDDVIRWNDEPGRTRNEVLARLDSAINVAEWDEHHAMERG